MSVNKNKKKRKKGRKKTETPPKQIDRGFIEGGYAFFVISDRKHQSIDYHFHTFFKCLIVLSGQVTYTVEGREYGLKAGDVLWVPSFEAHSVEISGKTAYKRCVVYLSEEFLTLIDEGLPDRIRRGCAAGGNHFQLAEEGRSALMALVPSKPVGTHMSGKLSALADFIQFISESLDRRVGIGETPKVTPTKGDQAVAKAIRYIRSHLGSQVTIDEVADHCYLSRYYLMHHFKEITGMTVHQYLTRERLTKARLLMRQDMSLTEIAFEVGFGSYASFARAFKTTYHMSPRQFMALAPVGENL